MLSERVRTCLMKKKHPAFMLCTLEHGFELVSINLGVWKLLSILFEYYAHFLYFKKKKFRLQTQNLKINSNEKQFCFRFVPKMDMDCFVLKFDSPSH